MSDYNGWCSLCLWDPSLSLMPQSPQSRPRPQSGLQYQSRPPATNMSSQPVRQTEINALSWSHQLRQSDQSGQPPSRLLIWGFQTSQQIYQLPLPIIWFKHLCSCTSFACLDLSSLKTVNFQQFQQTLTNYTVRKGQREDKNLHFLYYISQFLVINHSIFLR